MGTSSEPEHTSIVAPGTSVLGRVRGGWLLLLALAVLASVPVAYEIMRTPTSPGPSPQHLVGPR